MKTFSYICLIFFIFFNLCSFSQVNTSLQNSHANIATLIVDYDTYNFEGGNISYFSCPDCVSDSFPYIIDYDPPGDFGGITFKLVQSQDTFFNATIIWMGRGEIYLPEEFSIEDPFVESDTIISKPVDLFYIDAEGTTTSDTLFLDKADSAWNAISSLEITKLYARAGFESIIFLYPPTVGEFDHTVAKWIIFLYHLGPDITVNINDNNDYQLKVFPNPTNGIVNINSNSVDSGKMKYEVYNSFGQLVEQGKLAGIAPQLDISKLHSGLYFLNLSDDKGRLIEIKKVIKE